MRRLPLFPLGTVLVPGLVLPLHVFEPRYRILVEHLLALPEHDRMFGVIAIRQGQEVGEHGVRELHEVGCTAAVRRVTDVGDGRYDVVTTGVERFRLERVDESAGTAYLTGVVSAIPDGDDDREASTLARVVAERFAAYRERLRAEASGLPSSPTALSYLVAATMVLDLADRQALLEQPDAAARLRAERHLLDRECVLLDTLRALPAPHLARTAASPS